MRSEAETRAEIEKLQGWLKLPTVDASPIFAQITASPSPCRLGRGRRRLIRLRGSGRLRRKADRKQPNPQEFLGRTHVPVDAIFLLV